MISMFNKFHRDRHGNRRLDDGPLEPKMKGPEADGKFGSISEFTPGLGADVSGPKLGSMFRISGVFHLFINGV